MTHAQFRLVESRIGDQVKIVSFEGSSHLHEKCSQLGIFPGDEAKVLRIAPFDGPMLMEIDGREIALGKTIAKNILVEVLP